MAGGTVVLSTKHFTRTAPIPKPKSQLEPASEFDQPFTPPSSNGYVRIRLQSPAPPEPPKFRRMDRLPEPPPSKLVKKEDVHEPFIRPLRKSETDGCGQAGWAAQQLTVRAFRSLRIAHCPEIHLRARTARKAGGRICGSQPPPFLPLRARAGGERERVDP